MQDPSSTQAEPAEPGTEKSLEWVAQAGTHRPPRFPRAEEALSPAPEHEALCCPPLGPCGLTGPVKRPEMAGVTQSLSVPPQQGWGRGLSSSGSLGV